MRLLILNADRNDLENAFVIYQHPPERAARLALAINRTATLRQALEMTTDPWWKTRLETALDKLSMLPEVTSG